jgi:hypothetical protein
MEPLQDHLEIQMKIMKRGIEDKYGVGELPRDVSEVINKKHKNLSSSASESGKPSEEEIQVTKHNSYRSYSVWKSRNAISSVGWGTPIGRLTRKSQHNSNEKSQKRKESSLWYDKSGEFDGSHDSYVTAASSLTLNESELSRGISILFCGSSHEER